MARICFNIVSTPSSGGTEEFADLCVRNTAPSTDDDGLARYASVLEFKTKTLTKHNSRRRPRVYTRIGGSLHANHAYALQMGNHSRCLKIRKRVFIIKTCTTLFCTCVCVYILYGRARATGYPPECEKSAPCAARAFVCVLK